MSRKGRRMTDDISFWGLAASLLFVVVAVALSRWQRLRLEGPIVFSATRAMVQLLLVGGALAIVLNEKTPIIFGWLWVAAMVLFAAATVRRRVSEIRGIFWLAILAYGVAAAMTLGVIFGLQIFELTSRALVPLAGMMVGNSMTATVVAARRVVEEMRDKRDEVEARLALGLASSTASRPYVSSAIRTAMTPQIETTKAVGIVFLPGAMTGLILAGVSPFVAVKVQVVVMYLVLASVSTTTALIGIGTARRLFNSAHQLTALPREADI